MATITLPESSALFDGVSMSCQEDIVQTLHKIPLDNIALKVKAKKELRSHGFSAKDFARLWRMAHPSAETEWIEADENLSEILYEYHLNADTYVRLRADGIYVTNNKPDQDSGDRYIVESHIIFWKTFKVTGKYLVTFGLDGEKECLTLNEAYSQEWRYNGIFEETAFFHETEEMIKHRLQTRFTGSSGRDYITGVLNLALNDSTNVPDLTAQFRQIMGFSSRGWQLPDKYFFALFDDTSKKMYFKLKQVLARKYNKDEIIARIRTLYEHTGIEHKDIMFAWALYSPFAVAIRDYYGLIVMLALGGVGDRGKSPQAYTMTGLFYGHTDSNLGDTIQKSYSQMQSWMSSSTFPIVLDDCEALPLDSAGEIKSYTTIKSNMQKKGGGPNKQGLTVDKPYCADICMTFNEDPAAFKDSFFRERSLYMQIQTLREDPLWKDSQLAIEPGDMLLLLYEYTKTWTIKDLCKLVDSFSTDGVITPRNKKIIRCIKLGQYLFKQLIGIDLKLDYIKEMIYFNNEVNTLEFVEALRELYNRGRYLNDVTDFKSAVPWITHPLREAIYNNTEGYVLDLDNIRNLQMAVEGVNRNRWTFQTVFQKLHPKIFPNAVFDNKLFYALTMNTDDDGKKVLKKEKTRGIFVPKSDLLIINLPKEEFIRVSQDESHDKLQNAVHEEKLRTIIAHYEGFFLAEDVKSSTTGEGITEKEIEQILTILLKEQKIVESKSDIGISQYHLKAQ